MCVNDVAEQLKSAKSRVPFVVADECGESCDAIVDGHSREQQTNLRGDAIADEEVELKVELLSRRGQDGRLGCCAEGHVARKLEFRLDVDDLAAEGVNLKLEDGEFPILCSGS
jgi:hypothetical protein